MKCKTSVVCVFYFYVLPAIESLKMIELRVPGHAAEHGEAILGCQWEMEGDLLYSVKWFKDNMEFYRYVPRNDPPAMHFLTPGINVDMSRSSSDIITLTHLTPESAGVYRCEVCGEAPMFATVFDQKYVSIHLLPESGPKITGVRDQYQIGDRAVLNCSSPPSRPETQLKWSINDQPVTRYFLQGPWYRISMERPDAVETILQLRFTVGPIHHHFRDGVLVVKCQSTIAPLYQEEAVLKLLQEPPIQIPTDLPVTDTELRHLRSPDFTSFKLSPDEDYAMHELRFDAVASRGNFVTGTSICFAAFIILNVIVISDI